MSHFSDYLPSSDGLEAILDLNHQCNLEKLLTNSLLDPVLKFFNNSGKNIRPQLVEIGYRLSFKNEAVIPDDVREKLQLASFIIEIIHGGSLIVDDVQDNSEVRRNAPAFHIKHGVPLAINTGNWLYFWALDSLKKLELSSEAHSALLNDVLNLMVRAHFGQAIDIGTSILELPQEKVKATCFASMELKTGTLLSLALRLGCAIAGGNWNESKLAHLGMRLGVTLQMFDDVGNFLMPLSSLPSKRLEDLYHKRPTWIWAIASNFDQADFEEFKLGVLELPNEEKLNLWTQKNDFKDKLWSDVMNYLNTLKADWNHLAESHPETYLILTNIYSQLEKSYVSKT